MQYLASSRQYKGNCWGPFFFFLSSCFNLCFLSAVICFVSLWWIPSSKSKNIILPKIFMFHSVFPINTVEMGFFWKQTRWQFNKVSVHIISVCKNQQLSPILPGLYFPWYCFFQTDGFSLYILIKTFPHPHRWHHPHLVENNLKWECKTGCIQWHSSTH